MKNNVFVILYMFLLTFVQINGLLKKSIKKKNLCPQTFELWCVYNFYCNYILYLNVLNANFIYIWSILSLSLS